MRLLEGIFIALASLVANKLRSILTLIGVIIGVMTVIAITSIIAGMNKYVADQLSAVGSDTFFINKWGLIMSEDEWWEALKRKSITLDDMKAVEDNCPSCYKVGASADITRRVKCGNVYLDDVSITGVTANLIDIIDIKVEQGEGRYVSRFEEEHNRAVVFIGWEIKDKLFGQVDPIGKDIKIGNQKFRVVGIAQKRGSFLGQSRDNFVHVPITTFFKHFGRHRYGREVSVDIVVKAVSFESMSEAMDQARVILRARRHVPYDKQDDFAMMTGETFMDLYRQFTSTAYLTMIGISSIALLVGGIVIMNIMLVSVKERTREIGIRKALGARRKDVLWQFLIESVTLSLVGGMLGVLLGLGAGKIVAMNSPLPASADPFWIITGLILATSVGLIFGVYPAVKAARLDPIEALRYE
jgi:putative ABC transport system permease protein